MNLLRFFRNIYGKRIYFRIIFVILLALGTAIAQFWATKHLGDVIDAVEQGYEETMHQFLIIAVSMIVYIFGTAAFTFFGGKVIAGFSRCARTKIELPNEAASQNRIQTSVQTDESLVYEVRKLAFSYGDTTVLQDINFCVHQGEKIAVVGLSGCGKTTLFKLLSGLYTPEKDQIRFRGMDLVDLSSEYLRSHITVTTQEAFLFQATFEDNIKVAKSDGSKKEIITACKNAQADSFIQTFDHGYDTEINTTVQSISNGQMQRINLARAFFRNTDIFLLDEPTSALDHGMADAIWNYLFVDCADKTLLVILHDLEEVYRFHKVLVLDGGKAAAFGTHTELMQGCGLYRKLYEEKMTNRKEAGGVQ